MKRKNRRKQLSPLGPARWAAYATAGAATAFGCAATAEGEIHYSGLINSVFRQGSGSIKREFPLQSDAVLVFRQTESSQSLFNYALAGIVGARVSNQVRGYHGLIGYVSKLDRGVPVSAGKFITPQFESIAVMADNYYTQGQFQEKGIGFIGFRFNTGKGTQYGWARVRTTGNPHDFFILVDYAWGDPGDQIKTGQKTLANDQPTQAPATGALGFLALGAAGLVAWRRTRAGATV
jgi:hypothetical protein